MKRKLSLTLLLCVLSGMVFVGCEPKSDTTTGGSTPAPTNAPSGTETNK